MAKRNYWGGFCDDRLCSTIDFYNEDAVLAIYIRKKDAKKHYQDVRKVEVRIIKGSKKPKCQNS